MDTVRQVTFKIRNSILNEDTIIRKFNTAIDHWFHIETGYMNEDNEMLIVLVAEDQIILGYRDSDKPFILEYKFYMIDDLSEKRIDAIISEIKERLNIELNN